MSDIQRYNRGFGKFGPLEKCKDGELVKAEDALGAIGFWIFKHGQLQSKQDALERKLLDQDLKLHVLKTLALLQVAVVALFWVVRAVMANL